MHDQEFNSADQMKRANNGLYTTSYVCGLMYSGARSARSLTFLGNTHIYFGPHMHVYLRSINTHTVTYMHACMGALCMQKNMTVVFFVLHTQHSLMGPPIKLPFLQYYRQAYSFLKNSSWFHRKLTSFGLQSAVFLSDGGTPSFI